MRIVLVNWAKIWDGATSGGGVNGYCQALAPELIRLGHEVIYLSSGTTFVPLEIRGGTPSPELGECVVRRHPDWLGVRVFEVINSPVVAPSTQQFADPDPERSSPALEAAVGGLFAQLRPDVVHYHNIEGLSAPCIHAAKSAGARVVYSLHNYHTICPQTYLMRGHRSPCFDHENGHACAGCISGPDPKEVKRQLAEQYAVKHVSPQVVQAGAAVGAPSSPDAGSRGTRGTPTWSALARELRAMVQGEKTSRTAAGQPAPASPQPVTPPLPGSELKLGEAMPLEDDTRGITAYFTGKDNLPVIPGIGHREWDVLSNDTPPEPEQTRPPNAYGLRRRAMVDMLNACDRVVAVSDFVHRRFATAGVEPGRLVTMPIGTAMNGVARRHSDLLWDPPAFDPGNPRSMERPIRMVFTGFNSFYKGLHMFADALELLMPEYLQRLHVFIYAVGPNFDWRFRRFEHRLAGLTTHHGYHVWDVPWIMGGKDLAIVPSVWWDNGPQTVFEALACGVPVLGARLGGIPDFVRDGENGLLFRGNDRFDLARVLAGLIREPQRLTRLRAGVKPPKDIAEHARELESLYRACLCS